MLVTMDDHRREIPDGGLFVRDGIIERVGPSESLPDSADEVMDMTGHIVLPGLINTHHHFFQTLTRAVPTAQNVNLFNWLMAHYPFWCKINPEDIFTSTQTALAELALSGCTTASDHLYLYPNGIKLDDEIAGAQAIGLRLQASRGSMDLGQSQGGIPPDSMVEKLDDILRDTQRLVEQYHQAGTGAMLQVVVAPCSPINVTQDLMRESAKLARHYGLHLHTHLAETEDEEAFCREQFGYRPMEYMEKVDWVGQDVWFAHSIYINKDEIDTFARHKCGVAHCPSSNMRLASGIAPIQEFLAAKVNVGLGVDGSASNDGSHMLAEARQAMLVARVRAGLMGASLSTSTVPVFTARQALELATRGGAAVLGRRDIGSLEPGKCADFIGIDLNKIEFAGGLHDPVAAVVFCSPQHVDWNVVHGKPVVKDGELVGIDLPRLVEKHNKAAARLTGIEIPVFKGIDQLETECN